MPIPVNPSLGYPGVAAAEFFFFKFGGKISACFVYSAKLQQIAILA